MALLGQTPRPDDIGHVLVVNDDLEIHALIQDVLQDHGYRVSMAADGREALKQLSEEDYAVVLTDLRMKEMQGIELLRASDSWKE